MAVTAPSDDSCPVWDAMGAARCRSHVHVETQVDIAGGLTATNAPVLQRAVAHQDGDVVRWDTQRLQTIDDLPVEISLRVY